MNILNCKIKRNEEIADGVFLMELYAPEIAQECRAGQFINLYTGDNAALLPRPVSICRAGQETVTVVFRVVGKGTETFSRMPAGETIKAAGAIGNGFPVDLPVLEHAGTRVALIGGGIGIPPLLELSHSLNARGLRNTTAYLGYRNNQLFLHNDFNAHLSNVVLAVEDGNVEGSFKGNIVGYLRNLPEFAADVIYACGPEPMLRSLAVYVKELNITENLFISVEERMACGLGVCLGCAVKVKADDDYTYKKVCKDGPVFLAWDIYPDLNHT